MLVRSERLLLQPHLGGFELLCPFIQHLHEIAMWGQLYMWLPLKTTLSRSFNCSTMQCCEQWWACLSVPIWHSCFKSYTGCQFTSGCHSKCLLEELIISYYQLDQFNVTALVVLSVPSIKQYHLLGAHKRAFSAMICPLEWNSPYDLLGSHPDTLLEGLNDLSLLPGFKLGWLESLVGCKYAALGQIHQLACSFFKSGFCIVIFIDIVFIVWVFWN